MVKKKEESWLAKANWMGVVNFYCMQMSLVMSMQFIFADEWNDVPCSHHELESRPFNFSVIIHVYSLQQQLYLWWIQKQIVKYDIKSKYPEEYLTVDKVGS